MKVFSSGFVKVSLAFFLCAGLSCAVYAGGQSASGGGNAADGLPGAGSADTAKDLTVEAAESAFQVALADGASSADSGGVSVNNGTNTIVISAEGIYALRGTLSDGQVIVDVDGDVVLILNGVNITSSTGSPLSLFGKDKKVVTLAAGTSNTLSDASLYTSFYKDDEPNSALFARNSLTINGTGSLSVSGNSNNGIASKHKLKIMSGAITVRAVNAALKGKEELTIRGGDITITECREGLESEQVAITGGDINLASSDDGINASRGGEGRAFGRQPPEGGLPGRGGRGGALPPPEGAALPPPDGAGRGGPHGGGRAGRGTPPLPGQTPPPGSMPPAGRGVPAGTGGSSSITITGGTVTVNSGGDGLDANGSILIAGGSVTVYGPATRGNNALDADRGVTISGGFVAAGGAADMFQPPLASSTQPSLSLLFGSKGEAGSTIAVKDSSGKTLAEYHAPKSFQTLVISSPGLRLGGSYTVTVDGSPAAKVKLENIVTSVTL